MNRGTHTSSILNAINYSFMKKDSTQNIVHMIQPYIKKDNEKIYKHY